MRTGKREYYMTRDERDYARELWDSGLSVAEVSHQLGRTPATVLRLLEGRIYKDDPAPRRPYIRTRRSRSGETIDLFGSRNMGEDKAERELFTSYEWALDDGAAWPVYWDTLAYIEETKEGEDKLEFIDIAYEDLFEYQLNY